MDCTYLNSKPNNPARILIVDDNTCTRESLRTVLSRTAFDTRTVATSAQAVEHIESEAIDVVVVNLTFAHPETHDVIVKSGQSACYPEVIVAVEPSATEEAVVALKHGAYDCLTKPIETERLYLSVQRALEHRRLKRKVDTLASGDPSVRGRVCQRAVGFYDTTTKLPNRMLMLDRLEQAILRQEVQDGAVALIALSVDQLREVTIAEGMARADELLRNVAKRLREILFPRDTVAHIGTGELAVVVELASAQEVKTIVHKMKRTLASDRSLGHMRITLSAGVAVSPDDGTSAREMYHNAVTALYAQQHQGESGYQFYSSEKNQVARRLATIERSLEKAVSHGRMQLVLQPYHRITDDIPIGGEALLRWTDDEHGAVPPSTFIPMLEKTRQIIPLTEWIIDELAELQRQFIAAEFSDVHLSFNVSPVHLKRLSDASRLVELTTERFPAPEGVAVEITESTFITDTDITTRVLSHLKEAGTQIAIDDFGTGYSSLSYLTRFQFDLLKVDREFMNKMEENVHGKTVVAAIVSMARQLGLATVAEGVETQEQVETLGAFGCDLAQGYHYSRPIPIDETLDYFVNHRGATAFSERVLA